MEASVDTSGSSREATLHNLAELNQRLDRTVIEKMPYEKCIAHYDKADTFFFLDPPYLNAHPGVYEGWTIEQMQSFADVLAAIKGKWLVTVDDSRGTREIFRGYRFRQVKLDNKLATMRNGKTTMRELIITRK